MSVGQILAELGSRGPGLAMVVFAIPALIPSPGIPVGGVLAIVMAAIGLQMMLGRRGLALPGFVSRWSVEHRRLEAIALRGLPLIRRLERVARPRGALLAHPYMGRPLGLFLIVMAVVVALPIPFGNTPPALASLVMGLGLFARDGYVVLAGIALSLASTALLVAIGAGAGLALASALS